MFGNPFTVCYLGFIVVLFVGVPSTFTLFLDVVHQQPIPSNDEMDDLYPELSSRLFQGDILMPPVGDSRNALSINKYKWPNGTVYYEFDSNYTDEEKTKVISSMDKIQSKTCVKFIPREGQEDYIIIKKEKDKGCFAMIGYRPKQGMPVNLQAPECLRHTGTIEHELLHVLGLLHEQARPDRDNHVKILWDNIDKTFVNDFSKASDNEVTTFNIPYEYESVMHYPRNAFSKNGKDTIIPTSEDEKVVMGQRKGATENDLEKVRRMYNCNSEYDGENSDTTNKE